ncbi:TetR/AcrR family transcriptional regulator [Paenibacillus sp. JCM 10914]|uniref:TetR/AcrR family transcriptional regulator n=1 Tax=Paenibacillus sp. JCM 10914 TaxID=1236974 RepID=UPI0003CC8C71|nr:TetR/AcrR family transcriptional regulator [Paenibacillus sp. JCM 10914]GAE05076.1 transcriptional regulator [Paenibacillus sp. JCM 10914]
MPKIVDHGKQRQHVAEAALRVIQREGLDKATVRNIAVEAGLSVGSMRHYFSSQAELFAYCMNQINQRIHKRYDELILRGDLINDLKDMLLLSLPLDNERRMEMEVCMSIVAKGLIYPELGEIIHEMFDAVGKTCYAAIQFLAEHKLLSPGANIEHEAERLYALIDGLGIHYMMRPRRLSVEKIERIIEQHLQSLMYIEHGKGSFEP